MKLAAHACLFGERIKTETAPVLRGLKQAGFDAVEMGYRFFGDDLAALQKPFLEEGMRLSGFHCGVKFADFTRDFARTRDFLLHIAAFVASIPESVMPRKNVIMSCGFPAQDGPYTDELLLEGATRLEEIAAEASARSVRLHYHNHAPEFAQDARIHRALLQHTASLGFALDIGWIYAAGADVQGVLEETRLRIAYLHLRDALPGGEARFVHLGEGECLTDSTLAHCADILRDDGWAVVEYETGEQDFSRYARALDFLRRKGW